MARASCKANCRFNVLSTGKVEEEVRVQNAPAGVLSWSMEELSELFTTGEAEQVVFGFCRFDQNAEVGHGNGRTRTRFVTNSMALLEGSPTSCAHGTTRHVHLTSWTASLWGYQKYEFIDDTRTSAGSRVGGEGTKLWVKLLRKMVFDEIPCSVAHDVSYSTGFVDLFAGDKPRTAARDSSAANLCWNPALTCRATPPLEALRSVCSVPWRCESRRRGLAGSWNSRTTSCASVETGNQFVWSTRKPRHRQRRKPQKVGDLDRDLVDWKYVRQPMTSCTTRSSRRIS